MRQGVRLGLRVRQGVRVPRRRLLRRTWRPEGAHEAADALGFSGTRGIRRRMVTRHRSAVWLSFSQDVHAHRSVGPFA